MLIVIPEKIINAGKDFNARLMVRVRFVFLLKKILNPIFLEVCALVALVASGTAFVSLKSVFSNSPSITDFPRSLSFWLNAYFSSEMQLKIIIVAAAFVGELILFSIGKNILGVRTRMEGLNKMMKMIARMATFGRVSFNNARV